MQCAKCGTINEINSEVCQKCGAFLDPSLELETTISLSPVEVDEEDKEIVVKPEEGPLLVVKKGPSSGQKFSLTTGEVTLGRDPASDIFLDDITVSRHHARIMVDKNSVQIVDVDSLNGTYVNRELIEGPKILESNDELQIGKFKLLFLSEKWMS